MNFFHDFPPKRRARAKTSSDVSPESTFVMTLVQRKQLLPLRVPLPSSSKWNDSAFSPLYKPFNWVSPIKVSYSEDFFLGFPINWLVGVDLQTVGAVSSSPIYWALRRLRPVGAHFFFREKSFNFFFSVRPLLTSLDSGSRPVLVFILK